MTIIAKKKKKQLNKLESIMVNVGTQTDLSAEQITQMEKSIIKYQSDIQKEQNKFQQKKVELTNLQKEIKDFQEIFKEDMKELEMEKYLGANWENIDEAKKEELEEMLKDSKDKLKNKPRFPSDFKGILYKILFKAILLIEGELEKRELNQQITTLTQAKSKLQTQLCLATKTKEELSEEREVHQDAMKTRDRWYLQRNLELVEENRKKDQKIKELERQLENRIEMLPKK